MPATFTILAERAAEMSACWTVSALLATDCEEALRKVVGVSTCFCCVCDDVTSDISSPHCPFYRGSEPDETTGSHRANRRSSGRSAAATSMRCSSCGQFGHHTNESSECQHRISGRIFQSYVEGSPGRMYHDVQAPTLTDRCPFCEYRLRTSLEDMKQSCVT